MMAGFVHDDVQRSLLGELNLVLKHYFHQNVNDIMNDLYCQSKNIDHTVDPDKVIRAIYRSGLLYQNSDKILSQIRNAVARFVHGEYGMCSKCGGEIASVQLMNAPTADLCSHCINERYTSVYIKANGH
jgi:RNA polymerase-binding transcription factor DksA